MYNQTTFSDFVSYLSPLAERMRPTNLDEYIGQEHVLGKDMPLRKTIESDNISSMILWGPPGVGKTTLAMLIAQITNSDFKSFSAVMSGVKEIKQILLEARANKCAERRTIVFVDEIHRFNKSQQDAFLPDVEKGNIILIGATTENPSYEVNSALLSRVMVVMLKPLQTEHIVKILKKAIIDKRGLGYNKVEICDEYLEYIAAYASGDARTALNMLEMVLKSLAPNDEGIIKVDEKVLMECMQRKTLLYSKNGDEHFNIISALHKSMRNSDYNAAVYWLARMLEAGEDPVYVARRLIRFASEDIGLADSNALSQAIMAFEAVRCIGMPECSVNLTQAVVYLSVAPKSNALYSAYSKAQEDALNTISEEVPLHLRNASTGLMKKMGYGEGYQYAHDFEGRITNMECLPERLINRDYYVPSEQGTEKKIKERIDYLTQKRKEK